MMACDSTQNQHKTFVRHETNEKIGVWVCAHAHIQHPHKGNFITSMITHIVQMQTAASVMV